MSVIRINEFQAITGKIEGLRKFLNSIITIIQSSDGYESCRPIPPVPRALVRKDWLNSQTLRQALTYRTNEASLIAVKDFDLTFNPLHYKPNRAPTPSHLGAESKTPKAQAYPFPTAVACLLKS
ncbi:MAG TPA: hypothetical protein VE177_00920 [Candidatus Binatus sp.]|nr:hypothetical protein [Candidatus Binatus sp.]